MPDNSTTTNNNPTKKILVTGGTGFLGSYIIKSLIEEGYTVRAIRRTDKIPFWISPAIIAKIEWVEGDVLDIVSLEDAMEGIDAIIHAAAIVSFSKKDRKEMYKINVEGTANVVNVALEKNIHRFIHISSVAALGRTVGGGHVDEEKKWERSKANTHYAQSKFKAELQVWRAFQEGLEGIILNPSTVLGFGDWNSSSCALFKNVFKGVKWFTDGINGFVAVEDVALATSSALASDITEQRYIVNGENLGFKEIQENMCAAFGKKKPFKQATPFLLGIAWRIEKIKSFFTKQKPLITKESVRIAQSKTYFDNTKIKNAFPAIKFTPLKKTIDEACKKYLAQQEVQ